MYNGNQSLTKFRRLDLSEFGLPFLSDDQLLMTSSAQNLGCNSSVMTSSWWPALLRIWVATPPWWSALDDQLCSEIGFQLISWTRNGNQFLPKFQGQVLGDQSVEWAGVRYEALPAKEKHSISEQVYVKKLCYSASKHTRWSFACRREQKDVCE